MTICLFFRNFILGGQILTLLGNHETTFYHNFQWGIAKNMFGIEYRLIGLSNSGECVLVLQMIFLKY